MTRADDATIREMVACLAKEFRPEAIFLFGSRAWGVPDPESDVDLMVLVAASEIPATQRARRARRCLRGISVPKDVIVKTTGEFRRLAAVPSSLESRVLRDGRVLYGRF
ncbi:MAG: nucleotidyltransferase domain-containing protein [Thermodesulfobacteriota bacterium]